ncbi:MAG TPA: caspase family protein, partial [Pilimelia sp.]|nr:caspase family protein [Pilimelia sp.]
MPALPAVAANLRDLAGLLTAPDVGGLPAGNCVLVENPTSSSAMLESVHEAARAATDLLIVYFAGHGLLDEGGELYLALPDGSRDRLPFAVRFTELRREVVGTARRARAKVVVLDCCFSGRAMTGFMAGAGRLADQAAVEGAYLMTATAETVAALAPVGARHTAFTGALIETLRDGVPGGPALLDMETVFGAVEQRLRARAQPLPQRRSRDAGHRITIARNRAAGLAAPPEPPAEAPRRTRLWPVALAGLTVVALTATLTGLALMDHRGADRGPSPTTSPTAHPATSRVPPQSTAPAPTPAADDLTVNLYGRGRTPDGVVQIRVTEVGQAIKYFVVTPERTCRVEADVGDSTVISRPSGRWVRIVVLAA